MKAVKYFFKSFDVFGQPMRFSLNRKYLQKSACGGFLTFSLIFIFILLVFAGFQDLISRKNIVAYTQEEWKTIPPSINFETNQFSFAITFNDPSLNDPKYFKIEILQGVWTMESDGNKNISYVSHDLQPCSIEVFKEDLISSLLQKNSNLTNFLCPTKQHIGIRVQGGYSSPVFAFFWIRLSKCQNSENVTCVSEAEMDEKFIQLNRRVYLNVYISNNIISPNNFQNPINSFLDERIYVLVDRSSFKEKNFYFTQDKILTDTSILTTNYMEEYNTFSYENIFDETIYQLSQSDLNQTNVEYAGLFFRSNIVSKVHARTFEKIGKFIGYIGGFWSILYLFFSMIGQEYNQYRLLMKMANSLYSFPKLKQKIPKESNFKISNSKRGGVVEKSPNSKNDTFDSKIEKYIEEEKGANLPSNFKSLIHQKIYGIFSYFKCLQNFYGEIVRIRDHALMAIQKDTDIIYLLTKIKEINKLKSIFFSKNQIRLFEHYHKERISVSGRERTNVRTSSLIFMKKNNRRKSFAEQKLKKQESYKHLMELYECFYMVWEKNEEDDDLKNLKINDKILKLFDKDLMEIFKEKCKHPGEFSSFSSQIDAIKTSMQSILPRPSEFKKNKKKTLEFDKVIKEKI